MDDFPVSIQLIEPYIVDPEKFIFLKEIPAELDQDIIRHPRFTADDLESIGKGLPPLTDPVIPETDELAMLQPGTGNHLDIHATFPAGMGGMYIKKQHISLFRRDPLLYDPQGTVPGFQGIFAVTDKFGIPHCIFPQQPGRVQAFFKGPVF